MKKVVIMGGGPAGLTAAYTLLKESKDYEVIIIEKDKLVGGISKTITYSGNHMDLGGHRFFTKSETINNIWKSLMRLQGKKAYDDKVLKRDAKLERGGADPEKQDDVLLIRKRISRIYFNNYLIDYPVSLNKNTLKAMGFGTSIKAFFSYLKSCIFKRKENSLEDFYINRFGSVLYELFFKDYTTKVWGRSPKKISADWGKQRVKGLSIKKVLKNAFDRKFNIKEKNKETSLIEYFYYPKYGPGEMWNLMLKEIEKMGGKIIKNADINKINITGNNIKSINYILNGKEEYLDGDIFISSLPIKDLVSMFSKKDKNIIKITDNLPYRDFITVGLVLNKFNLKSNNVKTFGNIAPDTWIYIQDKNYKMGRIQIFNNWSPYLVKDIKKTVSIGLEYFASNGDEFWNMSDKEITNFAISELQSMGIIDSKDDALKSHVERVLKAYPAYFDSYKDIDKVINYLNKFNNLYCIGRNGQHRYNNMDHSMLTGVYAIDAILGKKDKESIWSVNTENEYLEEKDEK